MLRLTRLHLLIIFVALALAGYGAYTWKNKTSEPALIETPDASAPVTPPAEHPPATDTLISTPAPKPTTPTAAVPKRAAPVASAAPETTDTYEVVRGDTLWKIAQNHSPVHQGPGWVTIWRANQEIVRNFNRLEVGWNLKIPSERRRYVTAFWTPQGMDSARRTALPRDIELALLKQEPFPSDLERSLSKNDAASLPQDVELALLKSDPLPADLERALAKNNDASLPKDVELALLKNQNEESSSLPVRYVSPPAPQPRMILTDYERLALRPMPQWSQTNYH